MPTYRLTVAYDGTDFHGWAPQPRLRTVAGELAAALAVDPGALTVAGRTDAGVHAEANVVSLDAHRLAPVRAVNRRLPGDIALLEAERADGFDARADARARSYVYRLLLAERPDPFRARYELHHPKPLDEAALNDCAAVIVGQHDFRAFTPTETEHVFFDRTVLAAGWSREGDRLEFRLTADALLRHMVRVLVGTMLERPDPARLAELCAGAPRSAAGRTAPPHGLTLASVAY
ncbi:MAG TPA: tRNA pseudouridine synthase A [Gaiellales bacterium]|nr:tRNA pseudouridine synthase A [Gaiellales bacterium]